MYFFLKYFFAYISELVQMLSYYLVRVFKRAGRINAQRLILVGSAEWKKGMVRVKILSSGDQFEVKVDELE